MEDTVKKKCKKHKRQAILAPTTYPQVMYGSAILSMLMVALFNLTKTPLLICLSLKSFKHFLTFGWRPLILKNGKMIESIRHDTTGSDSSWAEMVTQTQLNSPPSTNNKCQAWLSWNEEVLGLASDASQSNLILLLVFVFSHILLGTLEDLGSLLLLLLLVQDKGAGSGSSSLSILLALLQQSLWYFWKTSGCWLLSSCRFLSEKGRRTQSN